jgi:hypothetical protein
MGNTDNEIQREKAGLESKDYLRLILQGLAIVGGLFGLFAIYCGIHFIVLAYTDNSEYATPLVIALFSFAWGGYLLMTAYLMVRKFSARALRHFSAIVAVMFFGPVFFYLDSVAEKVGRDKVWNIVTAVLSLLCLVAVYGICTKLLVRFTKVGSERKQ